MPSTSEGDALICPAQAANEEDEEEEKKKKKSSRLNVENSVCLNADLRYGHI